MDVRIISVSVFMEDHIKMQKNDYSIYLTPPLYSFSDEESDLLTLEDRNHLTHLVVQYNELKNLYALCCNHHQIASTKLEILRHDVAALRLVNKDLKERLNLLTETSVNLQKNPGISSGFPSLSTINNFRTLSIGDNNGSGTGASGGPTTTENNNRVAPSRKAPVTSPTSVFWNNDKGFDEKPVQVQPERVSLPKILSSVYLKMNQPNPAGTSSNTSTPFVPGSTAPRIQLPTVPAVDESKKGGVDGEKEEEGWTHWNWMYTIKECRRQSYAIHG